MLTPWDSDLEADPDPPDWTRNLEAELLVKMSTKEKQRQEVINGTRSRHLPAHLFVISLRGLPVPFRSRSKHAATGAEWFE